jgi:hypothetical protein
MSLENSGPHVKTSTGGRHTHVSSLLLLLLSYHYFHWYKPRYLHFVFPLQTPRYLHFVSFRPCLVGEVNFF